MDAMELDSMVECYADSEVDQFRIDVSDTFYTLMLVLDAIFCVIL